MFAFRVNAHVLLCGIDAPSSAGANHAATESLRALVAAAEPLESAERSEITPLTSVIARRQPVAVSTIRLNPARHLDEALGYLSRDEAARAWRLHRVSDRRRYILAHGVLRTLLAQRLNTAPDLLEFHAGPNGKPELSPPNSHVKFSLAYGRAQIALGLAWRPLGIDIEPLRDDIEFEQIGQRFFTASELDYMCQGSRAEIRERFFYLWTRKEAIVKATGAGLEAISTVDVLVDRVVTRQTGSSVRCYSLQTLAAPPGHALALALQVE